MFTDMPEGGKVRDSVISIAPCSSTSLHSSSLYFICVHFTYDKHTQQQQQQKLINLYIIIFFSVVYSIIFSSYFA